MLSLLLTMAILINQRSQLYRSIAINPIGVWDGTYMGKVVQFVFGESSCEIHFRDTSGEDSLVVLGEYKFSYKKRPISLSISGIQTLNHGLYTIVQYINQDSLHMAGFSPTWRLTPLKIDESKAFILRR